MPPTPGPVPGSVPEPITVDFVRGAWSGDAEASEDDLAALYAHPAGGGRGFVRTNFVASLDGSAQGDDGRSGTLNTAADGRVFATLRALADVVLVGAGTVRTEGYRAVDLPPARVQRRRAAGQTAFPLLVVVSGSLSVGPEVAGADEEHGDVMVVTIEGHEPERLARLRDVGIEVVPLGSGTVDVVAAVRLLADRGLPRILCEGGAGLHHRLLAADLVDDACLTLSSRTVGGDGGRTVHGPALLPNPTFRLEHLLHSDDGALLTRYRRVR